MKKGKKNLVLLISGLILTLTAISTNVFKNKNNPLSAAADNSTEQIVFDSDHFSLCESTNDIKEGDTIIFSDSYYRENGPKDSDGNFTDDKFINSIITYGLYDLFDYGPTEFQILYNHYFNNSFFPSLAYDAMLRDGNDPMDSLYRGNFVFTAEWVENHLYLKEKYSGYYLNRNIDTDNIFSFVEDPYQFISYDTSGFLTFGVPLAGEQTSVIFGSNGCVVDEPYITSPGINVSYEFPNVKNKTKTLGYEYEYWKIDLFRYKTTSSMTAEDVAKEFNEGIGSYCDYNGANSNLEGIKKIWGDSNQLYNELIQEKKDEFKGLVIGSHFDILPNDEYKTDIYTYFPVENNTESAVKNIVSDDSANIIKNITMSSDTSFHKNSFDCLLTIYNSQMASTDTRTAKFEFKEKLPVNSIVLNFTLTNAVCNLTLTNGNGEIVNFSSIKSDTEINTSSYFSESGISSLELSIKGTSTRKKSVTFGLKNISLFELKEEFSEDISVMLQKYDYIYSKYGSKIGEDFLGRFDTDPATQGNRFILANIKNINNSTWIIAVVSIIGLTSVGAYFFYRKRKEE